MSETCKECYFYSTDHNVCVKSNEFEFPDMLACNQFKDGEAAYQNDLLHDVY